MDTKQNWGYARLGAVGSFAGIARKHLQRMRDLKDSLPPPPDDQTDDQLEFGRYLHDNASTTAEIYEAASIAVVYAAISAESYIYDVAARCLGDGYVKKNLDKLSVPSKWLLVPRLISGHVIDTDGQVFQLLTELVKSRNDIVHHKTRDMTTMSVGALSEHVLHGEALPERAERAIKALDALADEATKFDPHSAHSDLRAT